MKKLLTSLVISCLIFACNFSAQENSTQSNSEDSAAIVLREFYTEYLNLNCSNSNLPDTNKIAEIIRKYSTVHFLKRVDEIEEDADYDPVINAQDCSPDWLKTLSINRAPEKGGNWYKVCVWDSYEKASHCITLSLIRENNIWKIDDVKE